MDQRLVCVAYVLLIIGLLVVEWWWVQLLLFACLFALLAVHGYMYLVAEDDDAH